MIACPSYAAWERHYVYAKKKGGKPIDYCSCPDLCREAKNAYEREYRKDYYPNVIKLDPERVRKHNEVNRIRMAEKSSTPEGRAAHNAYQRELRRRKRMKEKGLSGE
jgi:hypothetical protein